MSIRPTQRATAYYSKKQFQIFRIIFGCYLTYHFTNLYPYADKLFYEIFPNPEIFPSWGIFPSIINPTSPDAVVVLVYFLILLSISFTLGYHRRLCSFLLWYGWAYLFNRNVFIANPGLAYVGWLLLACVVIPDETKWSTEEDKNNWKMPTGLYFSAWFLMCMGYTISGIHKLQCPSWIDGSALYHVLTSVLARDNFIVAFLTSNPELLRYVTWGSLALEIGALPLGIFYNIRKWYWLAFIGMHVGIISVVNFLDLTLGVMMIHIFTFEYRWLNEFPFNLFALQNKKE